MNLPSGDLEENIYVNIYIFAHIFSNTLLLLYFFENGFLHIFSRPSTMWHNILVTLLVVTSCVHGQLTQEEVAQFTVEGGCPDPIIGAYCSATLQENGDVVLETNHVPNHYWETVSKRKLVPLKKQ